MSGAGPAAMDQALACMAAPALLPGLRTAALPGDVLLLLKLAASDEDSLVAEAHARGLPARRLHDVAVFYIQQVLFAPSADSYRVLGARPDASANLLREHYRWLVRWLHPDRNRNDWEDVYLERVHRAWQQLRTPERRRLHDLSSLAPRPASPVQPASVDASPARAARPGVVRMRRAGGRRMLFPSLLLAGLFVSVLLLGWEQGVEGEAMGIADEAGAASVGPAALDARRMALLPVKTGPGTMAGPAALENMPEPDAQAVASPGNQDGNQGIPPPADGATVPVGAAMPAAVAGHAAAAVAAPAVQPMQAERIRAVPLREVAGRAPADRVPSSLPSQSRVGLEGEPSLPRATLLPARADPTVAGMAGAGKASAASMATGTGPAPAAYVAIPQATERPSASLPMLVHQAKARHASEEMNDRVAFALTQKFRRAYNEGNPDAIAGLFLEGASRQRLLDALRRQQSGKRAKLTFGRLDWRAEGDVVVIEAGYRALGGGANASNGRVRFELRRVAGEFRILRMDPEAL